MILNENFARHITGIFKNFGYVKYETTIIA